MPNQATHTAKSGLNMDQIRPKTLSKPKIWANSGQKHGPNEHKHTHQKIQIINYASQLRLAHTLRGYRKENSPKI